MSNFYVYSYLRKNTLTPYYIGKGHGERAWSKDHSILVPTEKNRILMIETNLTELGAFAIERRLIRWYGRKDLGTGCLHNKTDGGEGASGFSIEARQKMSAARKGKSSWNAGKALSEETKAKMRLAALGKKKSETHRLNNSLALQKFWQQKKSSSASTLNT